MYRNAPDDPSYLSDSAASWRWVFHWGYFMKIKIVFIVFVLKEKKVANAKTFCNLKILKFKHVK